MQLSPTSQKSANNKFEDKKFYNKGKMNVLNTTSRAFDWKKNKLLKASTMKIEKKLLKQKTIISHTEIKFDLKKNKEIDGRTIMK